MKLARVVWEIGLVGGAIAGILVVSSPQLPGARTQVHTVAMAGPNQSDSSESLDISHLIGIAQFVRNPTQYGFVSSEGSGKVTSASLDGEQMVIEYTYPTTDDVGTGELIGTIDSDGVFAGTYRMQAPEGLLQGDITFTFTVDGTAEGHYDNETGTTRIFL